MERVYTKERGQVLKDASEIVKVKYVMQGGQEGGYHAVGEDENGEEIHAPLLDVRGAIARPRPDLPGYYLILGERFEKNAAGKHPLFFLAEGESQLQHELLQRFRDTVTKMKARVAYCYRSETESGFFLEVYHQLKGTSTSVNRAYHMDDVDFGVNLILEWLSERALEIPAGTILHHQLAAMTPGNLGSVIDPLRFLVSGYAHDDSSRRRREVAAKEVERWIYA